MNSMQITTLINIEELQALKAEVEKYKADYLRACDEISQLKKENEEI